MRIQNTYNGDCILNCTIKGRITNTVGCRISFGKLVYTVGASDWKSEESCSTHELAILTEVVSLLGEEGIKRTALDSDRKLGCSKTTHATYEKYELQVVTVSVKFAAMVELVDTQVSKTCDEKIVPVRVRLAVFHYKVNK